MTLHNDVIIETKLATSPNEKVLVSVEASPLAPPFPELLLITPGVAK